MEIKKMDFSEKKNALFKKAHKFTLLCDAEVSIIIISSNNELYEYTSPTSTIEKIIDQYKSRVGVDIWSSHYETDCLVQKMREELRRLEDVNTTIRREIMQRKGEELDDLNMEQLCNLEKEMRHTLNKIEDQKVKILEERQKHLREDLEMVYEYQGRDAGEEEENSCLTTVAMEVEDSV